MLLCLLLLFVAVVVEAISVEIARISLAALWKKAENCTDLTVVKILAKPWEEEMSSAQQKIYPKRRSWQRVMWQSYGKRHCTKQQRLKIQPVVVVVCRLNTLLIALSI